jgi:hypothetical protein
MAGAYPEALFKPAPVWLIAVAMVLLLAVAFPLQRVAAAVIVPIVLVSLFFVVGRPIYFPMRFESVIAGPLVLWIGASMGRWRGYAYAALAVIGAGVIFQGVLDHWDRPVDAYREAAQLLMRNAAPQDVVVATGYMYLETTVALRRRVIGYPADQAMHPGWRSLTPADPRQLPRGTFLWVGEKGAPELGGIRGVRRVRMLFENGRAIVARVEAVP